MVATRRTSLLAMAARLSLIALVALVALLGWSPAASAQDFTTTTVAGTFGGEGDATTTSVGSGAVGTADDEPATSTQEVIETPDPEDTRLLTESRRFLAVILGLVFVAIALTLLTIRYWRITKPVALEDGGAEAIDVAPSPAVLADGDQDAGHAAADGDEAAPEPKQRRRGRRSRRAVAGADHAGADPDWEPRATGEVAAVDLEPAAVGASVRPSVEARRRALGLPSDA